MECPRKKLSLENDVDAHKRVEPLSKGNIEKDFTRIDGCEEPVALIPKVGLELESRANGRSKSFC